MNFQSLFQFRRPDMAVIITIIAVAVITVVVAPWAHIEKAGYLLASGVGTGYLTNASKALLVEASRLAVLMVFFGLLMVVCAWTLTPQEVLAGSIIEDEVPYVVGAILGLLAKIEEG